MTLEAVIMAAGIPSAILGIFVWWFKRYIDKRDARSEEREANIEKAILMIMQTGRANNVLATATARAVQRIPDAHCNGDMTEALEQAAHIQKEEQAFLINQGIQHLFRD